MTSNKPGRRSRQERVRLTKWNPVKARRARVKARLTQVDAASAMKITVRTLQNWEAPHGTCPWPPARMDQYARILACGVAELTSSAGLAANSALDGKRVYGPRG